MTVHVTSNKSAGYRYLRCQKCKSGGLGAPDPQGVYDVLVDDVLRVLGDFPVHYASTPRGLRLAPR